MMKLSAVKHYRTALRGIAAFILCVLAALLVYAYASGKLTSREEDEAAFDTVYAYGISSAE